MNDIFFNRFGHAEEISARITVPLKVTLPSPALGREKVARRQSGRMSGGANQRNEAMANDKVILLQDATGQVRHASVNGTIFSVVNAGPIMIPGKAGLGASLTISPETADVTIELASSAEAGGQK